MPIQNTQAVEGLKKENLELQKELESQKQTLNQHEKAIEGIVYVLGHILLHHNISSKYILILETWYIVLFHMPVI